MANPRPAPEAVRLSRLLSRPPRAPTALKVVALLGAIAGGACGLLAALPTVRPPEERLGEAVTLVDTHPPPELSPEPPDPRAAAPARARAAALALPLLGAERTRLRPGPPPPLPDFPGAAAYVVGMEAFGRPDADRSEGRAAAAYLMRAEREGVPADRRRRGLAATGLSLARAGRPSLALPRLTAALDEPPAAGGVPDAILWPALVGAAVAVGTSEALRAAADRLNAVDPGPLPRADAVALHRARGRIALERNDPAAAAAALSALREVGGESGDLAVELALATRDVAAARRQLPPVPRFPQPRDVKTLQLHGRVSEAEGDAAGAIRSYQAAAALPNAGADGTAARLAAARLLTAAGRLEEAAATLAGAVRRESGTGARYSRELRDELRRACAAATAAAPGNPSAAVRCATLCDLSEPALGAPAARRLKARALEAVAGADPSQLAAAAAAFGGWADVEPDLALRRAARLSAARHHRAAGAPAAALVQLDRIPLTGDADPGGLRLLRAELLLDRGEAAAALEAAEALVEELPADPAAPAARALIGRAAVEAGDAPRAAAAFAAVLADPDLTPAAAEWRESLFARAHLAAGLALAAVPAVANDEASEEDVADRRLSRAIDLLGECLVRYPHDGQAPAARVTRARCRLARRQRLDAAPPPADPLTRKALAERTAEVLTLALQDFRDAEGELGRRAASAAPSPADVSRLRLARLGAAECLTRLGRTEAGAVAIAAAVDRDPLNVRSAAALLDLAAARRAAGDELGGRLAAQQARLTMDRLPEEELAPGASPLTRAQWDRLFLIARREAAAEPPAPAPVRDAAP